MYSINYMTQANYYGRTYIHSNYNYVIHTMYMYCIERNVNVSITRITRVNNKCFWYVAICNDILRTGE